MALQIKNKFLEDNSVTTAKILDANVTSAKLASSIDLIGTPTAPTASFGANTTQIATTAFVQSAIGANLAGLKPKASVLAATTANGTLATAFANGSVIDGVTLTTGDRILIKDQSTASQNGIYIVAASGAPTRASDFDSLSPIDEINGAWVSVREGSANAGKVFVQYGTVTTVGTDPITFTFYDPIGSLIGGDSITVSGSTINIDLATTSGLESTNPGDPSGQLRIKLEASSPTLRITGSNELAIKLDGAGAIVTGASGIKVAVDNSTIEINSNALRVKDLGITNAKIANGTIDLTAKVTGILPVANGGSGRNTLTSGALLVGAGTSAVSLLSPGSNGDVLTVVGGAWVSQAPTPVYTWNKEKITLTGTDISNGYVDLAHLVVSASIIAFVERLAMQFTDDYTVSTVGGVTRITFAGSLATGQPEALVSGDILYFTYQY